MKKSEVKPTLYKRIRRYTEKGLGYTIPLTYNEVWFEAAEKLKKAKKIYTKGGKLFAYSKKP